MFIHKISRSLRFVVMALVAMTLSLSAWAQNISVTGTVTDVNGEPIIGAYVLVQGTSTGTSTDVDGKYQLSAPSNGTLVFTMVGMKDAVVAINGKAVVNATMQEDAEMLEDVVVVGWGTQKKANLSGAVSTVAVDKALESRPISDVGRALQGATPGVIISTTSGAIGGSPTIRIRGQVGSIGGGGSAPLILVDNVEVPDLSYVNPEDIESMSVLKDAATTAVYGARAAFGAILITTKKGSKERVSVTYSNNFAFSNPTKVAEHTRADLGIIYALDMQNGLRSTPLNEFNNVGTYMSYDSAKKVKEWIDKYGNGEGLGLEMVEGRDFEYRAGGGAYYYRPWDVNDMYYNSWVPMQTHNFGVNGGSETVQYNLSGAILNQTGTIKANPDSYNRYNVSMNITAQAKPWLKIRASYAYTNTLSETPFTFASTQYDPQYYLYRWFNVSPLGTYNGMPFRNGITELQQAKTNTSTDHYNRFTLGGTVDLGKAIKGLTLNFDYTYWQLNTLAHTVGGYVSAINQWTTTAGAKFEDLYQTYSSASYDYAQYNTAKQWRNTYNGYLDYSRTFGKHKVNVVAGTNIEDREYVWTQSRRKGVFDFDKGEVNLAGGDQIASSNHSWWSVAGFFARLNYTFADRYILEVNGRYDGSSKFPADHKWGFFPSVSAAWRISEEPWMEPAKKVLTSMKIRGSWGAVGNQDVPLSSFIPTLSVTSTNSNAWLIGNDYAPYVGSAAALVDPTLTWEKVTTLDFGVDFSLFNAVDVTFDWYQRRTSDVLSAGDVIPSSVGASAPKKNYGELTTNGYEIQISYNKIFANGLQLNISGQLTDYQTEVTKFASAADPLVTATYYEGKKLGEIWGYVSDGLFQVDDFVYGANGAITKYKSTSTGKSTNTAADGIDRSYLESGSFLFSPGDVKFKDLNGDGFVNQGTNTVGNSGDRTVIGNSTPRYQYGIRLGAKYKGFDAEIFFQGVGKRDLWATGNMVMPGYYAAEANFAHTLDYWTPENTDAFYPRPLEYSQAAKWNYVTSDRYLLNGAYFRCKNLQVGYSLPSKLLKKVSIDKCRIYFSGENLFEFDKMGDVPIDPEMNWQSYQNDGRSFGRAYPYRRTISFGVQFGF